MIPWPLRRRARKCLEIVNTGGPATGTFDPTIGVSRSRPATMLFGDGSSESKTGTSLAYVHTYSADGTWRARLLGVPLREITSISVSSDCVVGVRHLRQCVRLSSLIAEYNPTLRMSIRDVPAGVTYLSVGGCPLITGDLSDVPAGVTTLSVGGCPLVTGDLSDVPARVTIVYLYNTPLISPVGIHLLTSVSDIRIHNNGYSSAVVDACLEEMYTHRMSFTAAAPSLHIGGTNAAPSGVYQNASPPTTGLEYVYKLVNDPDGNGHKKWAISWTGGSAP